MTAASAQAALQLNQLLTNDLLVSIFDRVSLLHRRRLSRVCQRWRALVDVSLLCVRVFSAVDARRCICDWEPSSWMSLQFVGKRDYIRVPKISASDILARLAPQLPNLSAIDLECCDMSNRIIRNILNSCKRVERINLDSSTRLNYYSFNLLAQDWQHLRHVNLSCCTEVNELSARYLIQNLQHLESLNLCGTRINGACLADLSPHMRRLDISYCWAVQEAGLLALARAPCRQLLELSVNNFDFDRSESCLVALCEQFQQLKHLQMSIGPCVAHDYFIDRLTQRGFSAIARMRHLETLIIEKICLLDNASLSEILRNCTKLKRLRLNLSWLNHCTDLSFGLLGATSGQSAGQLASPISGPPAASGCWSSSLDLEELHISYPSMLSTYGLANLVNLRQLRSLTLVNTNIDNEIFKLLEPLEQLAAINFDDCRKVTLRGLNHLCRIATKRPQARITASLLGTGITVTRLRGRKNFPPNLTAQVSNFRATKFHLQLPPPPPPPPVIET